MMRIFGESPGICDLCHERPATIQFMEKKGNQTRKIALCAVCAEERGIKQEGQSLTFDFGSLLTAFAKAGDIEKTEDVCCPRCGMTVQKLKENGKVGCASCYTVFSSFLNNVLSRVHPGIHHRGMSPECDTKIRTEEEELEELKRRKEEAVEKEDFELAARLRDEIRKKERSLRERSGGKRQGHGAEREQS
ncbi:MAG: hypothetical protein D6679_02930 [Candidatus Hydrogenedentota bacterium]|nr:MAG: hypothetical protein D6679_02930 [Candidatus Hydrogenedentota bacterium]